MPEVVEVKKYVDLIHKKVSSNVLIDFNILNGRYKKHKKFDLFDKIKLLLDKPLTLVKCSNKGKLIYFEFSYVINKEKKTIYLINTLGLMGGWAFKLNDTNKFIHPKILQYVNNETISNYLLGNMKHINVEFIFKHGTLYFYDMLSFGTLKFIDNYNEFIKKLNSIGPDIMDLSTTKEIFIERLSKYYKKNVGIVLLNQKIISGIGNYLRSDSLWLSKINPFRKINDLSKKELEKLFESLKKITWGLYNKNKAIKLKILNEKDIIPSTYKRDFFIYGNNTDIYNNKVVKEELYEGSQKRFIYWCPAIQK